MLNHDKPIVTVLQEYVPDYRVAFFEHAKRRAAEHNVLLRIAAGTVSSGQTARNDAADLRDLIPLRQREFRLLNRRVTVRRTGHAVRGASLVILEQARRNIDAYRYLFSPRRSRKVALWGHGADFVHTPNGFDAWLHKRLTSRADWFFAYTDRGAHHVENLGFDRDRVTVVNNSTDTSLLRRDLASVSREDVAQFKQEALLTGPYVLALGSLDTSKRLDFLERAMAEVFEKHASLQLAIAGDGPLRHHVEAWQGRTRGRVRYLGKLGGRQKAVALTGAKALVNPGRVGLVAVDALVASRPIITTDWHGHAPEFHYLRDGRTAQIVSDEPSLFAQTVIRTIDSPDLLKQMGLACQYDAKAFSAEAMADKFVYGMMKALES